MTNLQTTYDDLGVQIAILKHRTSRERKGPMTRADLAMRDELNYLMNTRNRVAQELFGRNWGSRAKELLGYAY